MPSKIAAVEIILGCLIRRMKNQERREIIKYVNSFLSLDFIEKFILNKISVSPSSSQKSC